MKKEAIKIAGRENEARLESRILEERIQRAVAEGYGQIEVTACGQHGLGGRLWRSGGGQIKVNILGTSGQRVGSMGFVGTSIEVFGPASDDIGWLNAGAQIIVHGDATNGAGNAMAQGKIYIEGDIGARGMTMTKHNPRFEPPELWVFGKTGDSFAEFMAGGTAVICGVGAERENDVLGYRPCVGMVGGKIFFRGRQSSYSQADARLITDLSDEEWRWLRNNLKIFLEAIGKQYLHGELSAKRSDWRLLIALKPHEKKGRNLCPMSAFKLEAWEKELGPGGLIGDLTSEDRSPIGIITTGELRRYVPVWENGKYLPPCQAHCPTGIPVQKRWELIRKGKINEAVDLALNYTPFAATVCGYLCPNLCMQHCSRQIVNLPAVDIRVLGKASLEANMPKRQSPTGRKVAIIGGGPAGLSVAWQLWLVGHDPAVYESKKQLGGKIAETIPKSRIPEDVFAQEIARLVKNILHIHLDAAMTRDKFKKLKHDFDFIVIAAGATKPRKITLEGIERAVAALDFLRQSKLDSVEVGANVVIIGAGNVGCDAAAEAARLGAKSITLIDVQKPASFGPERRSAEAAGAKFVWPRFAKAIKKTGVELADGEFLPADTVIVAVGDLPDLAFLPEDIATQNGYILTDENFRTSDAQIYAIGDSVRPGLLTEAVGAGRVAAAAIDGILKGRAEIYDQLPQIDAQRVKTQYFDARETGVADIKACAAQCASCGACRDCGLCEAICPQRAISRRAIGDDAYEYAVEDELCIGCGFCAGACPTGVWYMVENKPLE